MKLYEMTQQFTEAFSELEAMVESGQLPAEAFNDTIEALKGEFTEKAKNVAAWIKNLELDALAIKRVEQDLLKRRKSVENKIDAARNYLKTNMERAGVDQIPCQLYTVSIMKNPPAVIIDGDVPVDCLITKTTSAPDKKKIKEKILAGECDFAHLNQTNRLVIK